MISEANKGAILEANKGAISEAVVASQVQQQSAQGVPPVPQQRESRKRFPGYLLPLSEPTFLVPKDTRQNHNADGRAHLPLALSLLPPEGLVSMSGGFPSGAFLSEAFASAGEGAGGSKVAPPPPGDGGLSRGDSGPLLPPLLPLSESSSAVGAAAAADAASVCFGFGRVFFFLWLVAREVRQKQSTTRRPSVVLSGHIMRLKDKTPHQTCGKNCKKKSKPGG